MNGVAKMLFFLHMHHRVEEVEVCIPCMYSRASIFHILNGVGAWMERVGMGMGMCSHAAWRIAYLLCWRICRFEYIEVLFDMVY